MELSYNEFLEKIGTARMKGKRMRMPRFTKNLSVDHEGIYSYGTKIAELDMPSRSILRLGYYSPTSSHHYYYMLRYLQEYGFNEVDTFTMPLFSRALV